jgi:Response regulator of citrate/malate metabolism
MKNKYLKGAHLSERKVRELLKLFCEDLTATQIANITGISRITVNAYFKLIRTHIAKFCEERNPLRHTNGTMVFIPISKEPVESNNSSNGVSRKSFYGILRRDSFIYTEKIGNINPSWLYDWFKGKVATDQDVVEKFHLHLYNGIADFNTIRLFRLVDAMPGGSRGKSQIDEIDLFWGMLKSRLIKFRGLNGSTLYLHVKETEFRYNYRDADLFEILMDILNKRPLHYSKTIR